MKYLLILILAFTPLLALSGWTIMDLAQSDARAESLTPNQLKSTEELVQGVESRVGDLAAVEEFEDADLFSTQEFRSKAANNEDLKKVQEAWERSEESRQFLVKFLPHRPAGDAPRDLAQAERELKQLTTFRTDHDPIRAKLKSTDDLFRRVDNRIERLQQDVERFTKENLVASALATARDDLAGNRFSKCLDALDREPLKSADEAAIRQAIEALRSRAKYLDAWTRIRIDASKVDLPARERRLAELNAIDKFLKDFHEPVPADELPRDQELRLRIVRLKVQIAIEELETVNDLNTLLKQGSQIVQSKHVDATEKDLARAVVKKWLELRIPEPPKFPKDLLLGKEEAVTKTAQRLIGIFLLPPGNAQYRFWKTQADKAARPIGDLPISTDGFLEPPGSPKYVQWQKKYQEICSNLLKDVSSESAWQVYARECKKISQDLTAYRQKWGVDEEPDRSCREWSLDVPTLLAETVVERWAEVRQVLGK